MLSAPATGRVAEPRRAAAARHDWRSCGRRSGWVPQGAHRARLLGNGEEVARRSARAGTDRRSRRRSTVCCSTGHGRSACGSCSQRSCPPRSHQGGRWLVEATALDGPVTFEADFLADARGRADMRARTRRWTGARTLALHAYWRGPGLPTEPRIEAGEEAWYWAVPLPDGTCNTLVFVDARRFRAGGAGHAGRDRFLESASAARR